MTETDALEMAILEQVASHAPVSLEDLQQLFGHQSWNRLFAAIDRLSRRSALTIRRIDRCTYIISLGPRFSTVAIGSPRGKTTSTAIRQS